MSPSIRRAIVIFPETPAMVRIELLRAAFDPLAMQIPAHLTLVFPFESAIPNSAIEAHIRAATAALAPFAITFRGITGSEGEYLFLNVKRGNDDLIAVHDRLYDGLLAPFLSSVHSYLPHLTIGRVVDPSAFPHALHVARRATEKLGQVEAEVRTISSFVIAGDGQRSVECSVAL